VATRLPAHERRRQLLDVARDVFGSKGFHATSMEEIADTAGVTKPVLYQHFGSKRALYRSLLEDVGERLMESLAKATAEADGPREQVTAGFRTYFRFVAEQRSAFNLLFGSGSRRDEEFAETVRRLEERIADLIAPLIEAGIDDDHRRLLAHGLIGLAEGVGRYVTGRDLSLDPELAALRVAELAWAGLRGLRPTRPE
jgi:AcrR family transcriptional regulator